MVTLQEMIKGEQYGYDADLWAFGVFVFEMLMGMFARSAQGHPICYCSAQLLHAESS